MTVPPDPSGQMPPDPSVQQHPQGFGPYPQQGQYVAPAAYQQQPGVYQGQSGFYQQQPGAYQAQPYAQPVVGHHQPHAGSPDPFGYPQQLPQPPREFPLEVAEKRGKARFVIAGSVVVTVVAALLFLGFVAPGFLTSTRVSAKSVQNGIKQVISNKYGLSGYGAVSCPGPLPTKPRVMMTCTVEHNGTTMPVVVESRGNSGEYFVYPPGQRPSEF